MSSWKELVELEDVPEHYQIIARSVGMKNMTALAIMLEKMQLYFKRLSSEEQTLPPSELTEDYQLCIAAIGREATFKLAEAFPLQTIYLQSAKSIFIKAKVRYIKRNFNGKNHRTLAMKTRLSQVFIYVVLRKMKYAEIV